jgi:membrane AbrB-like protein
MARNALLGLIASTLGGALCAWLKTPLPWMIGPLLAMAICNFSGAQLAAPRFAREVGQLMVAVTLGLYFTPMVARETWANAPMLLLAAFAAFLIGAAGAQVLSRVGRVDRHTAFFGSIPGGAAEMANLGERFGAAVDKVAVAHSLRILLVVLSVPVALTLADVHGGDTYQRVLIPFSIPGLLPLFAIAAAGGMVMMLIRFPNPWLMGPLVVTIIVTAAGFEFSSMHALLTNGGQVLLGCALGTRFSRKFLDDAQRYVIAVLVSIAVMIALAALMGLALAHLFGVFIPSMILATAPGGIAEMSITARNLELGVALVTAAHVIRVLVIVSLTLPLYHLLERWRQRAH